MSTKPKTSSAPRPAPVIPPKPKPEPVVHQGKVSLDGTAAKDGWKHK
jgi:hypothetical protein